MEELRRALPTDVLEQVLPLILEIIPGQAGEGLIDIYEPGGFEGQTLRELCEKTLRKTHWSIEERLILEDIHRQLDGGRLLIRGQAVQGTALDHAVLEETEAGEKYLYVPIRAIKAQEGGQDKASQGCKIVEVHGRHWDADCPQCRQGLQRLLEVSEALYDEMEHAVGMYRMPLEDHCNHESVASNLTLLN